MKQVFFTRHGKSSWDDPFLKDHDRPLKKRGNNDARLIASVLKQEGIKPEMIFSSTALRAKETALIFKNELDIDFIQFFVDLYHAGDNQILEFLSRIETNHKSIMIFGHNPGFTDMVNRFANQYIYNVPTSGTYCIEFDCDNWANIPHCEGVLKGQWFPRAYKK